jgi:hypothetical protein
MGEKNAENLKTEMLKGGEGIGLGDAWVKNLLSSWVGW